MKINMKAFYFATEERKLRYDDNRAIVVGETHEVLGKIELCRNGLHASKRILDAIQYAPGPILYLVELSGKIVEGKDKCAASSRKYIAEFNATEVLRKFARKQAIINIELIKPYCKNNEDYNLIVKHLETGDEEIRIKVTRAIVAIAAAIAASAEAASAAAWAVAWAIVAIAAVAEADAAYWAVAEAAAWAAEAAAWAAKAAEYEKLMSEANIMLTDMIREATGWDI